MQCTHSFPSRRRVRNFGGRTKHCKMLQKAASPALQTKGKVSLGVVQLIFFYFNNQILIEKKSIKLSFLAQRMLTTSSLTVLRDSFLDRTEKMHPCTCNAGRITSKLSCSHSNLLQMLQLLINVS